MLDIKDLCMSACLAADVESFVRNMSDNELCALYEYLENNAKDTGKGIAGMLLGRIIIEQAERFTLIVHLEDEAVDQAKAILERSEGYDASMAERGLL